MHTVSDSHFEVSITEVGAELCSFKSNKTGIEYIWQGNPSIWGSHAPVLFPIIGCLKDNYCSFNGEKYNISKHGIIRNNEDLTIVKKDKNSIEIQLINSEKTKKSYPFQFDFRIKFILVQNKLTIEHSVTNLDYQNPLYFSLGGHPAFNCPFEKNSDYTDYFLSFEHSETLARWEVTNDGLIKATPKPFLVNQDTISLTHQLFEEDALIFKNPKSNKIELKNNSSTNSICVEFSDFSYLGIWAKPNGDFVCIEPWLGISDSENSNHLLIEKEGIITLAPSKTFKASYSITINED